MHETRRPRFRPAWLAACGVALALSACQTVGDADGVRAYGNIEVSKVTSDAGGMEIEIRRDGARTSAFVVICEGGCRGAEASDVVSDNATLTFRRRDPLDRSAPAERFVFRWKGGRLVAEQPHWVKGQVLKRTRPGRTREWARYH